ncbi:MAG: Muropeptide transporter AmpG [Myxococcales bacterium]|nr:Muropeptide transporter AmpG [Myxococcales bacterium]
MLTLQESKPGLLSVFRSRRMAVLFAFGFSSGLPLLLTGQTLQAWVTGAGVSLDRIAALNSVGLAYTFKFLWAPLLDRYRLPLLGRRRGWILVFQLGLVGALAAMGTLDPITQPELLVILAVAVAFLSASQDVVLDAYSVDILEPHQRPAGSAVYVQGYRIGMVVAGSLAFVMADQVPWRVVYWTMAALMSVGIIANAYAEEPPSVDRPAITLAHSFVRPFVDLFRRLGWRGSPLILGFAPLYGFGHYFAQSLVITFLKDGVGFTNTEIGATNKTLALVGATLGYGLAGVLGARYGLRRMLVGFGLLAALTNVFYVWLSITGKSFPIYCSAVLCDNLANAMVVAAFMSVLMSVCSPVGSATQFALLTSLASVGQRIFGPLASNVVQAVGWTGFYVTAIAMAIPGLVLAWLVARRTDLEHRG